jgi:hypothetical protein
LQGDTVAVVGTVEYRTTTYATEETRN